MPKIIHSTKKVPERALLIAATVKGKRTMWSGEDSIEELAQLADTAGAVVVGKVVQHLEKRAAATYLGKGKLEELGAAAANHDYDVVLVDDELTPMQQQHLEKALNVKVIDRAALILDIFAKRAITKEGQLQVELAQHEYLLPRLEGQWSHLERLGGGIGTRGPGESQLETDRRLIRNRMAHIKKEIEAVRKHRELYRVKRQRTGVPIVALVGYTNAGKSTLLNAVSDAKVFAEDKLFSTLDPTTRQIVLADGTQFLLTDTVGFIQKLPPTIVTAFRATLEELAEATLLLHVVDMTSHNASEQFQTVEKILRDLKLTDKPRITALNKIDLLLDKSREWDETSALEFLASQGEKPEVMAGENTVLISAVKKWGLTNLKQLIARMVNSKPVTG